MPTSTVEEGETDETDVEEVVDETFENKIDYKKKYLYMNSIDTSVVKFVVLVGYMLREVGKIPWNHSPKRRWFHSIYILGWKVPELWFHGNSMERSSRWPTLNII
jgi:hypothetical protein